MNVKQSHKTLLLWVLLITMFLAIWQFLQPDHTPAAVVPYSEFVSLVQANKETSPHVESVKIKDREYAFSVKDPKAGTSQHKVTYGPVDADQALLKLVSGQVSYDKEDSSPFW